MTRYWIFDREDTPQGLALGRLVRQIWRLACDGGCEFVLRRSQGYGVQICEWDALLDDSDEVRVSIDELERLTSGVEEWLYNLDVKCITPQTTISFGVHDSSAMFVDARAALVAEIITGFSDVRQESTPELQ